MRLRDLFHRRRLLLLAALFAAAGLWLFFGGAGAVNAQDVTSGELLPEEIGTTIGTGTADIRITIARIIRVALGFLGTLALLLVLYAGFLWMTAAGDQEKVQKAKRTLAQAVIGLVIIIAAFSITSFIISSLVRATTGVVDTIPGGGGPGGGGFGSGAGGAFRPTAIQPSGSIPKYDVVPVVTFSAEPTSDAANIRANILLEKVVGSARTPVDYDPVVQNRSIKLVPKTACPDPNGAKKCLERNTDYAVTVRNGLRNADTVSPRTVNCNFNAVCSKNFRTGEAIGTELPTVAISSPTDGQSVPAGDLIGIQSLLTDQYGIANVDYFADGAFVAADGAIETIAPSTFRSQASWDDASVVPVKTVALTAKATNIDGDEATSSPVRVVVRPAHCFNAIRDADETGPDCGGADCGACTGGSCTEDAQCASGECVNGRCVENPEIVSVDLGDGKPGNLITIQGLRFGATAGTVTFLGTANQGDEAMATLAQCADAWSDTRIAVIVPQGAVDGPIRVRTAAGKEDATNDSRGRILDDFDVNDAARPGLCSVSPKSAKVGRTLTLTGNAFGAVQGASRVVFARAGADCAAVQSFAEAAEAGNVGSWNDTTVQPNVPNVETGANGTNYLVRVEVGGQPSNTACIRVEPPEAGTEPRIDGMTPESGSVGTYVTLIGANFGTTGRVRFVNGTGTAIGDVNFPAQCSTSFWTSTSVTVKVPENFTTPSGTALNLGAYQVSVVRSDGRASNAKTFTVNNDPLRPGICKIEPNNGPAGLGVKIYGEGFGNVPNDSLTALRTSHPDSVLFSQDKGISTLGLWRNTTIATAVPDGAVTGPVAVRRYTGATFSQSNGLPFNVRDCRQAGGDAACASGETCCPDGSCSLACGGAAVQGAYAWLFSTGPLPVFPVVVENATCQLPPSGSPPPESITPSPNPFKGSTDVCTDIGAITLRFSLPMQAALMNSTNVVLEACDGDAAIGSTCARVATGAPFMIQFAEVPNTLLQVPVAGLEAGKWHRLTIKDEVMSDAVPPQPLDGNFDGKAGGDYVTTFKTGTAPCVISAVDVQPGRGLIDDADQRLEYVAQPLSSRCIVLQCSNRTVAWTSSNVAKATVSPAGGLNACRTVATPVSETEPGPAIDIRAVIDAKSDVGQLRIDYANPRVVKFGPNCDEACVNAAPFAEFNTPMAQSGAGDIVQNVILYKCLNESCLAYEPQPVPLSPVYDQASRRIRLNTTGSVPLDSNSFYRVVIRGTASSTSGAPLTGLNFNNQDFSWIFRTRPSGTPCGVSRVQIDPDQTTLRYIGEIGQVNALPYSAKDKCSDEGQLLMAEGMDWGWSKRQSVPDPERFTILPNYPVVLSTTPTLPAGCSASCVMTGSRPPGSANCGNNVVETGEECDDGNDLDGDLCTSRCLLPGNTAATCGNGTREANLGEACDAGPDNGKSSSGCSVKCLLTGSVGGTSVCGNGSVGQGEACDDGNTKNGDGCSSSCLKEGSSAGTSVCGNGQLEAGEQCDYVVDGSGAATQLRLPGGVTVNLVPSGKTNPRAADFPCTNVCLLRGNANACASGTNCCGNGTIDSAYGESCDAALRNGRPGSGCSKTCLKTGSDPYIGAFCGDGEITTVASVAGVDNGGGEECEGTPDNRVDPRQFVKARNQCDAQNSCEASVVATVQNVKGTGAVNVECSCTADSDCATFGDNLSCGAGACCYQRPDPPDITPKGGNECRNALVAVTFPERMDEGTLTGNLLVKRCGPVATAETGGWFARLWRGVGGFFRGLVGRDAGAQAQDCVAIQGQFRHITFSTADGARQFTRSTFSPAAGFDANAVYRVEVVGGPNGVKSALGVGYATNPAHVQTFSTGAEFCQLDLVEVEPNSILLASSAEVVDLMATPMTDRGGLLQEIAPIAGVYDWGWAWSQIPQSAAQGKVLDMKVPTPVGPEASIQATKGKNGSEQIAAIATITANSVFPTSATGTSVTGKAGVQVMLCDNPWPRRDTATGAWSPYVDPETHFSFFYCRDNAAGVLPELFEQPTPAQTSGGAGLLRFCGTTLDGGQPKACANDFECNAGDRCRSKDLFFLFRPEWKLRDAFGMRVYDNRNRLTPQDWYEEQRFSGQTEGLSVDGYEAIKDQRTVYAVAPDKYGDPEIRVYTYVFGFTDRTDPRTVSIFDQIIQNLRFNTNMADSGRVTGVCKDGAMQLVMSGNPPDTVACSSDLDCYKAFPRPVAGLNCDAPREKLKRDLKRWRDLTAISERLESIRATTGSYPKLESGTFVRGMTTSAWPSWSQQLGSAGALKDPLNAYAQCERFGSECAISRTACETDAQCDGDIPGDTCKPRYEDSTCYDEREGIYACPAGSHVYHYQSVGGVDYRLSAEFEYEEYGWAYACGTITSEFACEAQQGCAWDGGLGACTTRFGIEPVCGGVYANENMCLRGGGDCDASAQCSANDTCQPRGVQLFGSAVGSRCGNGIIEGEEQCEIGDSRAVDCPLPGGGKRTETCSSSCLWEEAGSCPGAPVCGDGSVELDRGETCDDGFQNGQYGRCRSGALGCAKRCVSIVKRDRYTVPPDVSSTTCVSNADCGVNQVCTDRMNFCGDGVRNGTESCDDGALNGQYGKCAWDCRGPGPRCGDLSVNGGEQCDGNSVTAAGICVPTGTTPDDAVAYPDGSAAACAKDSDCGAGKVCALCKPTATGIPQTRSKSCVTSGASACTFNAWTQCKPSGSCGNGSVEGTEECDAGSANSVNGACLPTCKKNVCGDGFWQTGTEQCDNGSANGRLCTPEHGFTCNYCKNDCTIETVSGAFCGDRKIAIGTESCDPGPVSAWCARTYRTLSDPDYGACLLPGRTEFSDTALFGSNTACTRDGMCPAGEVCVVKVGKCAKACNPSTAATACGGGSCKALIVSCANNVDCKPGVCRNYPGVDAASFRAASVCGNNRCELDETGATCAQDCGNAASSPLADTSPTAYRKPAAIGTLPAEGAVCWSANDCAPTQFCDNTEGECIQYGAQCRREPYSNLSAAQPSPRRIDGSCNSCNSSCVGATQSPPLYCGDLTVQPEFGEQCDGNPDPNSIGKGSQYQCGADCASSGGFCGDGVLQSGEGEICDVNMGASRVENGVITGKVLDAAFNQGIQPDGTASGIDVELWEGGTRIATVKTNAATGVYTFSGINIQNTCKVQRYTIRVPALTGAFSNNRPDRTRSTSTLSDDYIQFTTLGYFAKTVPSSGGFGFSCGLVNTGVKSITRGRLEMQEILLVPKLKNNEYLILTEWEGSLGSKYLDLHLRRPDGGATDQGTYYASAGNQNLDLVPHSFLYCYHSDGTYGCGSFDVKPQTMMFKWANDAGTPFYPAASSGKFRAWVTDYACATGGNTASKPSCTNFATFKMKVQLYDRNGLKATYGPLTGSGGGYWELFSISATNGFRNINARSSTLPDNTDPAVSPPIAF